MRRYARYSFIALLTLCFLLAIGVYSLNYQSVQSFLWKQTERWLQNKLQTTLQLGNITVVWPNQITLSDLLLLDRQSDTLLYVNSLQFQGELSGLWNQRFMVSNIALEHGVVGITQQDSTFNFDFILDAFSSPASTSPDPLPWTFHTEGAQLNLRDIRFSYKHLTDTLSLTLNPEILNITLGAIDPLSKLYTATSLQMEQVTMHWKSGEASTTPDLFDPNNFQLEKMNLLAQHLYWKENEGLRLQLMDACAQATGGIALNHLSGDLTQTEDQYLLANLSAVLNQSYVQGQSNFNADFSDFEIDVEKGKVSVPDIRRFVEVQQLPTGEEQDVFFQGLLTGTKKQLQFDNIQLSSGQKSLLLCSGSITDYSETNKATADLEFKSLRLLAADVQPWLTQRLPSQIQPNDFLSLSGTLRGGLSTAQFAIKGDLMRHQDRLQLQTHGQVFQAGNSDRLSYECVVDSLRTTKAFIEQLLPADALPPNSQLPDEMSLAGLVQGNLDSAEFDLQVLALRSNAASSAQIKGAVSWADPNRPPAYRMQFGQAQIAAQEVMNWLPTTAQTYVQLPKQLAINGNLQQSDKGLIVNLESKQKDSGSLIGQVRIQGAATHFTIQTLDLRLTDYFTDSLFALTQIDPIQDLQLKAEGFIDTSGAYQMDMQVQQIILGKTETQSVANAQNNAAKSNTTQRFYLDGINIRTGGNFKNHTLDATDLDFTLSHKDTLETKELEATTNVSVQLAYANYQPGRKPMAQGLLQLKKTRIRTPRPFDQLSETRDTLLEDAAFYTNYPADLLGNFSLEKLTDSIQLNSDWINLRLTGLLSDTLSMPYLQSFVTHYFNNDPAAPRTPQLAMDSKFGLDLWMQPQEVLPQVFLPGHMHLPKRLTIQSRMDAQTYSGNLDVSADDFRYKDADLDRFRLSAVADGELVNYHANLTTGKAYSPLLVDSLVLQGAVFRDTLQAVCMLYDAGDQLHGRLAGRLLQSGAYLTLQLDREQNIANTLWEVDPLNSMTYHASKGIQVAHLTMRNQEQEITLNGHSMDSLVMDARNLDLALFSALLPDRDFALSGRLQANVVANELSSNPVATGTVQIDSLVYQDVPLGQLEVLFSGNMEDSKLRQKLQASITQQDGSLHLDGEIVNGNRLDLDLQLDQFELRTIEPFLKETLRELKGKANGHLKLTGTTDKPKADGVVQVSKLCLTALANGVKYCVARDTLRFQNDQVQLDKWKITDEKGAELRLSGHLLMTDYTNPGLDLVFKAKNLMLLNPKVAELSSLAYKGEVYADVYGTITGTSILPEINVGVKTAQPSHVEYNHAYVQNTTDWSEGIIVFQTNDTTDIALSSESESKTAMQLNLAFEDQNLLKLKAVINPLTGDYFEGIGTGVLQVYQSAGGDLQMTGQYRLNDGTFLYQLNKFISRRFVISPGSQITWSGNPYQPELGLTAYYVIRAQPPRNSEEANENIGHETFLLGIHINGYLDRPTFSFSILFPTGEEGTKYGNSDNPELAAYIESINRDPTEVTNQMFSLLTLGKFVGNDDVKNIFGETLNMSTVFAKKLNDLTQDIKFVDIEFNTIDNAQGSAALGLTLRRSLLENRLILRVSSSPFQDNGAGLLQNFSAEYALTPSGKWKLRAFGVPENSQFFQETQTLKSGAGVLFTRSFRRFLR